MAATLVPAWDAKPRLAATRNGFGEGMLALGEKNKNVVALCADLTESTRLTAFKQKFPERFVEMGVSEQNMATVAAGMALMGKIPFMASFAVFSPGRNWEQIRTTICYNDVPVKIVGAHAGISVGQDGATHQALEDVALMRALPNMTVLVPCDAIEARKATIAAAQTKGPVYLRLTREKSPVMTTDETPFEVGEAAIARDGSDVTIVACGPLLYHALLAAKMLEKEGVNAQVIDNHTIKPIDKKTLTRAARNTGAFVTIEEHQITGGLGSAVAEAIADTWPVPIKRIGIQDRFGESGAPDELLEKYGLTAKNIVKAARSVLDVRKLCSALHTPPVETPGEAGRLISEIAPDQYFRLWGGEIIHTVPELKRALEHMDTKTFRYHVNNRKNDFSAWIKQAFGDTLLAEELRKHPTKEAMIALLTLRLKEVKR
jgi:transketolase